jgi:lipopolysaccharide/colanic/teichoic acid biosynthesis glycosyltransferase
MSALRTGWQYRIGSAVGVFVLSVAAVFVSNHPFLQSLFTTYVPLFWRLEPTVLTGEELVSAMALTAAFVSGSLIPLYKPRPWRLLDIALFAQKRIVVAGLGLATLGYFQWSSRLPRATLVMAIGVLLVAVPAWFVQIRRPPRAPPERCLIVGDDVEQIRQIVDEADGSYLGYLCPSALVTSADGQRRMLASDGGVTIQASERLGGLSRIEDVLVKYDVDTVLLAFEQADRSEFFGTLDACYEHGVAARVHRDYADSVLTSGNRVGSFVDVDIEPWDIQDHIIKRGFDLAFAGGALLVLSPVIAAIVIAIKLEGEGPVLFSQTRTYIFGETFTVYKFRTLKPDPEGEVGTSFDGTRETPLGNFLRMTHLDEIPQLWSILVGDMSVVGPRPAQTEIEDDFEAAADQWRQRWFVKPGLTGLAQINDATSSEPREKIEYDLQYIRNQSFSLDVKIVVRQIWKVLEDVASLGGDD